MKTSVEILLGRLETLHRNYSDAISEKLAIELRISQYNLEIKEYIDAIVECEKAIETLKG